MSIGFRIKNGSNVIQIDESYRNMEFAQKGTVACTTPVYNDQFMGQFTVDMGSFPALAIYSTDKCFWYKLSQSGNSYTIRVICQSAISIEWFVFREPETDPHGIGIRIKDPVTGVTVYNSLRKSMKVLGWISGNTSAGDPINTGITNTFPGKKVGLLQGVLAYEMAYIPLNPGNPSDVRHIGIYTTAYLWTTGGGSSPSVLFDETWTGPYDTAGATGQSRNQQSYGYMYIDLTGY